MFQIIAREYLTRELRQSSALLQVRVQDMNDNWPSFNLSEYKATIPENSPLNTSVVTVQVVI